MAELYMTESKEQYMIIFNYNVMYTFIKIYQIYTNKIVYCYVKK
jgi:hypothetical protein